MLPDPPRFHAPTWYHDRIATIRFDPIEGARRARTVVVGGGLAGLSTAWSLHERGHDDVIVLEAGQPAEGASGRNGGFVFGGFSLDARAMARRIGLEATRELQLGTRDAVALVRERMSALGLRPDGEGVLLVDWFRDPVRLEALRQHLAHWAGQELDPISPEALRDYVVSEQYGGALYEREAFHFNPLAYAQGLARRLDERGATVCGDSPVRSLDRVDGRWVVSTAKAQIQADRVVVATGGYDRSLVPSLARAIQPIGTYIAVTEPLGEALDSVLPGEPAVYDTRFAFDYYRRFEDRLLWGGRISVADRDPRSIERLMRRDLARVFPSLAEARFSHAWGGWMSYARHQMPIVGELEPGLWLASAFGGHGMAPTTLVGEILAEAMQGQAERLGWLQAWGRPWAGSGLGRVAVQGEYWWRQARDAVRDRFGL
jgi:glycine/D-amino acid oxidase-like deaminating enzyme